MTDYAAERGVPAVPTCARGAARLAFDGTHLRLYAAGGDVRVWPAASGKPRGGQFDYGVDRQQLRNAGPIPAGEYWVNPSELWQRSWKTDAALAVSAAFSSSTTYDDLSAGHDAAWGGQRLTIHPYPDTPTHGRGGFFLHGGSQPGSAGCIDLTDSMGAFVEALRASAGKQPNCFVTLTVTYPS